MHPSLQLSNLSKLPPLLRKRADDALNGSHDAFHALTHIEKMNRTTRRLIIPVFYTTLDPAHIGELHQLESLDPEELARRLSRAFQSLQSISILNRGDIPPAAFMDLWPRVWQCIDFLDAVRGHYPSRDASCTFALFMEVFATFLEAANTDDRRAISKTPGIYVLIGTAWSYLARTEHSNGLRLISIILYIYTADDVEPTDAAFFDGIVAGAGGTWTDLASTVVTHLKHAIPYRDSPTPDDDGKSLPGVARFLYNYVATTNSQPDFHEALFKQGIIPALITICLARSSWKVSDLVQPLALSVVIAIIFTHSFHYNRITEALREGFFLALFSVVPRSYEIHQPQLCHLLDAHLPACTVIFTLLRELEASFAEVKDLDPALHFRTPALLHAWRGFVKLLEERLQLARERKTGTKFRACDNFQCGQFRNKDQLKRCSGCQTTYYCSRECQKADYRDGGHRGDCWEFQQHHRDHVSHHDAKNRSFFRALLNHDYAHQQEKIALMLLAKMHAHPQENTCTVFSYIAREVRSDGRMRVHIVNGILRGNGGGGLVIPLRTTGELFRGLRQIAERMPPSTDERPIDLRPYRAEVQRLVASESPRILPASGSLLLCSAAVKSKAVWRKQMAKWQEELQAEEEDESERIKLETRKMMRMVFLEVPASISVPTATAAHIRCRGSSWLPTTLANLFSGAIAQPFGPPARRAKVMSEEALYMELLTTDIFGAPSSSLSCASVYRADHDRISGLAAPIIKP
ncbi:hypothetical protein GGX14DRAFT_698534 [Mycena pura]|uniref:MYND-type domain-containing protein n=1 Tax=Mycena pura TaxID=153505 RepID=A0AAD6YAF8_9AGAR|nr:hypothetical protein GGX14DRAFT_698534 [Mycena pura]